MATSYHLLLGQALPLSPSISPQKVCPAEEQPSMAASLAPTPRQSPRLKRCHPSPELMGSMPMGRATPAAVVGGPPSPKKQETPPWFKSLKPSWADAFLRDSALVVGLDYASFPNIPITLIRTETMISLRSFRNWLIRLVC